MMTARLRLIIGCATAGLCFSGNAVAQATASDGQTAGAAAPADPVSTEATSAGIGDIIVTAQKRDETLQKTPASIQVVGAAQLVDRGVSDLTRITNQITGIAVQPSRQSVIIFSRGLGQSDTQSQTPVAVEVQQDGLTLSKNAQQFAFFDVANIQALKGPQGILYGRNAVGGAVLVTSKRPTFDRRSAEGNFEYGNYDTRHATVAVNIPLGADVAVRAAGDYLNHDGYQSNGGYSADVLSGRLSVAARPSDDLSLYLAGTYSKRSGNGYSFVTRPFDPAAGGDDFYVTPVPTSGIVGVADFNEPRTRGFDTSEAYFIAGEVDYSLGRDVTLTYVGGYFHYTSEQVNASGVNPGGVFQSYTTNYFIEDTYDLQNEVRLSYDRDGIKAIVGVLQHKFETPITQVQLAYRRGPVVNGPYDYSEFNYAIFGNVEVPITSRLRVEGGLRQSWDRRTVQGTLSGTPIDLNSSNFPGWQHLSWKVGLQYDATDSTLAYVNVQNGYLPGSFQSAAVATLTALGRSRRYDQVTLTAYTAGFKSRFADDRIQINGETFYYDYNGFQVNQRIELIVAGVSGFQNAYGNVRKSRIYGSDFDIVAKPVRNGTATVGISLLDAEIVDTGFTSLAVLQPNGQFVSIANPGLKGYRLPNSPTLSLNLGYEQEFPIGDGASVIANVGTHHESGKWLDFTHPNIALARQGGFWKTDVSVTYRAPDNRWYLSAFGRNLENAATYSNFGGFQLRRAGVVVGSYATAFTDVPRTYGVRVGFNL